MFTENDKIELKIEYKSEIKKEIVAFLNSSGGTIYIGVSDDGIVHGVDHPKEIIESVTQIIHDSIKPDPSLLCKAYDKNIEGKHIVIVEISMGAKKPYYIAEKGMKSTGVYIRMNNTSQQASDEIIRRMLLESENKPYELMVSINQELSFDYLQYVFKKQKVELKMKNLRLINSNNLYTNLALLLSDQNPYSIKLAVYEGDDKSEFVDRKEFGGSLFKQVDDVYEYLMHINKNRGVYDGLLRVDKQDYDPIVLRETLLNAIIHRDYSLNGSILISVFNNRIDCVSIGGLVYGMTYEDMMLGVSRSRNENLAYVFFKVKYVEAYGTGIEKIKGSYKYDAFKPIFNVSDNGFNVVLPNRNVYEDNEEQGDNISINDVIMFIKDNTSVSRLDIEQRFNIKKTKASFLIKSLLCDNKIKKIGAGPNIKYVISE